MADALILEFPAGVGKAHYDTVNGKLGIDTTRRDSNWPEGMVSHAAGPTEDGGWVVIEVWDSQAAQGKFMEARLGPALHEAGLPAPSRVTWIGLVASTNIGG
jgi:hypothetical protein